MSAAGCPPWLCLRDAPPRPPGSCGWIVPACSAGDLVFTLLGTNTSVTQQQDRDREEQLLGFGVSENRSRGGGRSLSSDRVCGPRSRPMLTSSLWLGEWLDPLCLVFPSVKWAQSASHRLREGSGSEQCRATAGVQYMLVSGNSGTLKASKIRLPHVTVNTGPSSAGGTQSAVVGFTGSRVAFPPALSF